ncbi:phage tail baseplate protein [Lentibacter algarum]|uniref:GTA baseplate fiber-binding domain-containing protein n=1 Tax=Lentibacter algarum TaxID=576131 RepID=UPI003B58B7D6
MLETPLRAACAGLYDRGSVVNVRLTSGSLALVSELAMLNGATLAASVRFCTFGLQGFGFVTLVLLALYWGSKRKGYCHAAAQNQPRKARSCLGTNQG